MHHLIKSSALKLISSGIKMEKVEIYTDQFNELTHLKKLLVLLEINCILDVGTNVNVWGKHLAKLYIPRE
jgi:hypothetical protein